MRPSPERLDEHRKEGRRGLADAGRGLDEELLAGAHGPRHGGHHLALPRSEAPEREDELVRLGRLRLGEGELAEELREDGPDSRDEVGLDLVRVPRDRDEARVARLDVGQDEPSADRASLRSRDGEEVPLELAREAVEAWRSEQARQLLGEVDGLHLVDDDRPVLVLESAVQAPFEDRREAVDGEREADGLLHRVAGNRGERLREDAAVDGLADPSPLHRVAPAVPDAAGDGCEEGARRERHCPGGEVDPDRHAAFYGRRPLQSAPVTTEGRKRSRTWVAAATRDGIGGLLQPCRGRIDEEDGEPREAEGLPARAGDDPLRTARRRRPPGTGSRSLAGRRGDRSHRAAGHSLDERRRRADPRLDDEALHDRGRSRPARARLPVPDDSSPGRGAPPRRDAGGTPRDPRWRRSGDFRATLRERSVGRLSSLVRGSGGARHPLDPGRPAPGHVLLRRREDAPPLAGRPGAALVAGPRLGPFVQRQRRPGPGDGGDPPGREGQPRVLPGPAVPDVARRPGRDAMAGGARTWACRGARGARGSSPREPSARGGPGRATSPSSTRPSTSPRLSRRSCGKRGSTWAAPPEVRTQAAAAGKAASGSLRPRDPDPPGPGRLQQEVPVLLRRADPEDARRREARERQLEGRSGRGQRVRPVAGARPVPLPDRRRLGPLAREPLERLGLPRLPPGPRDAVEVLSRSSSRRSP